VGGGGEGGVGSGDWGAEFLKDACANLPLSPPPLLPLGLQAGHFTVGKKPSPTCLTSPLGDPRGSSLWR